MNVHTYVRTYCVLCISFIHTYIQYIRTTRTYDKGYVRTYVCIVWLCVFLIHCEVYIRTYVCSLLMLNLYVPMYTAYKACTFDCESTMGI